MFVRRAKVVLSTIELVGRLEILCLTPAGHGNPPDAIRASVTALSNTPHIYMGLCILLYEEIDRSVQLGRT